MTSLVWIKLRPADSFSPPLKRALRRLFDRREGPASIRIHYVFRKSSSGVETGRVRFVLRFFRLTESGSPAFEFLGATVDDTALSPKFR